MNERYEFIRSIHPLKDDEYQMLTGHLKSSHHKKGDNLVVPGQIQDRLYFVRSGVQMYHFDAHGKTNILGFAYSPNLCAVPESFFYQKPSQYYVTCLTDSEMDSLSFAALQQLFDQSQQIERLFRKMSEALIVGLINRQIELRSTSIEERFKAFCQRSPHLLQLVPHKYIASYLAIDPTNFSKLFNTVKF